MSTDTPDTKYHVPDGHWDDEPSDRPAIDDHARERWHERFGVGVSIEVVLDRAVAVHDGAEGLFTTNGRTPPDEVLLAEVGDGDLTLGAVFLVVDDAVKTTYRVASRYDYAIRAYCRARLQEADSE